MSFRVRSSKFRHVFGKAEKRDHCYDNIRITKSSWDAPFCDANPKFVAVVTDAAGGGAFLVLPIDKYGRVDLDAPKVCGHKGAVLDIKWCPHNDNIIASSSEDCSIKIWNIPDQGLVVNLTDPVATLSYHQRRVGVIQWHPTAQNILLSGGHDNLVLVWNVEEGEIISEVEFPDIILGACWSFDGSRAAVSCKDKRVTVIDPRAGQILHTTDGPAHDGAKGVQVIFLKTGKLLTTGFSRMSERQMSIWDPTLQRVGILEIDTSNGVMFPFYDPDNNLVYLCGKGDSVIRYYEIVDEEPYVHWLAMFQSNIPQRGFGWMPKRGLNVRACEIARFYKLHAVGMCEVIPMTVPRKSELFQDDIYPDTISDEPALSAQEWIEGKDAPPKLMSMKELYDASAPSSEVKSAKAPKKSNLLAQLSKKPSSSPAPAAAPTPASQPVSQPKREPAKAHVTQPSTPAASEPAAQPDSQPSSQPAPVRTIDKPPPTSASTTSLPPDNDQSDLVQEVRLLRDIVRRQERRIDTLERRIIDLEEQNQQDKNIYLGDKNDTSSSSEEGELV